MTVIEVRRGDQHSQGVPECGPLGCQRNPAVGPRVPWVVGCSLQMELPNSGAGSIALCKFNTAYLTKNWVIEDILGKDGG